MRNRLLGLGALIAFGSIANADVLLDNLTFTASDHTFINASQDFEAANDAYDVAVMDDFVASAIQTRILSVEVILAGFMRSGFVLDNYTNGVITNYRVEFYTSPLAAAGNLTGDAGSTIIAPGAVSVDPGGPLGWTGDLAAAAHVVIPVDVILPGAGTYWVGVIAVMDLSAGGQVGITEIGPALDNQNSEQANPGGAFGLPGNHLDLEVDSSFKVEGFDPIPEPASIFALGLGAAALAARRRRKKA